MKIDAEVINTLFEWAGKGRRDFEISGSNEDGDEYVETVVWVYDYDLSTGDTLTSVANIEGQLKQRKRKELSDVISESQKQLRQLGPPRQHKETKKEK